MAHMSGIFAPDDMSKWPAIDPHNPDYRRDLVSLQVRGTDEDPAEAHAGLDMGGADHMQGPQGMHEGGGTAAQTSEDRTSH
jgi:hypothetical protein